ncbi:MAG: hypothetical protein WCC39_18390 [Telluria sp.]
MLRMRAIGSSMRACASGSAHGVNHEHAWAFALPLSPFAQFDWYSSAIASIAGLVVSTLLGLMAPLFQRPRAAP